MEQCPEHAELMADIREVVTDVKWLVNQQKHTNEMFIRHVKEAEIFRPKVEANCSYRLAFIWAFGIYGAILLALVAAIISHVSNG